MSFAGPLAKMGIKTTDDFGKKYGEECIKILRRNCCGRPVGYRFIKCFGMYGEPWHVELIGEVAIVEIDLEFHVVRVSSVDPFVEEVQ